MLGQRGPVDKSRTGSPRKADGKFDYDRAWGWYVDWARRDERTVVFARLVQDEKKQEPRTSLRARDSILEECRPSWQRTERVPNAWGPFQAPCGQDPTG